MYTRSTSEYSEFFMGKFYPIIIAAIITAGHFFEYEMISATVVIMLLSLQLCLCDSIRPALFIVPAFILQVPLVHSPGTPIHSDYLFTGWRLIAVLGLAAMLLMSVIAYVVRLRLWRRISFRRIKILPALLILAAAFLTNGLLSETWSLRGFIFGAVEAAFFLLLFMLLFLGLSREEDEHALLDYVTYITLIFAAMILLQMGHLFAFGDAIKDGAIVKGNVNLGWATCNPLGAILVTLIPTLFYGAMTKRNGFLYFVFAGLVYVAAVCTCSRNALLFGTLIYALCLIIAIVKATGRRGRIALIVFAVLAVAAVAVLFTLFREKMLTLFSSYVNQGMDDSGRIGIWKDAWEQFLGNSLFGAGFFTSDPAGGIAVNGVPFMVHNTPLEFLSSAGIVGLIAYFYYRAETIRPLLMKPTLGKTMLGLSYLVIVAEGLLDVFVLGFYMMLYPFAIMAATYRIYEIQMEREPKRRRM